MHLHAHLTRWHVFSPPILERATWVACTSVLKTDYPSLLRQTFSNYVTACTLLSTHTHQWYFLYRSTICAHFHRYYFCLTNIHVYYKQNCDISLFDLKMCTFFINKNNSQKQCTPLLKYDCKPYRFTYCRHVYAFKSRIQLKNCYTASQLRMNKFYNQNIPAGTPCSNTTVIQTISCNADVRMLLKAKYSSNNGYTVSY